MKRSSWGAMVIIGIMVIAGSILGVKLAEKQSLFTKAATGQAKFFFEPDSLKLPESTSVQVWVDTSQPAAFVRSDISFDPGLIQLSDEITPATNNLGRVVRISNKSEANVSGKITIALALDPNKISTPPSGTFMLATIKLKPNKSAGAKTNIIFNNSDSQVVGMDAGIFGINSESAAIDLNSTAAGIVLKFRIAFAGIGATAACADPDELPLSLKIVSATNRIEEFGNIVAKRSGSNNKLSTYDVTVKLTNITERDNLAVLVKSPKSLRVKYGKNDQNVYYKDQYGDLDGLTTDEATTPLFHFENYPLFAGDVTGENGSPDGQVDGRDFSYVKNEVIKRTRVGNGGYIKADLNGNCQLESTDLVNLMMSLKSVQEQTY